MVFFQRNLDYYPVKGLIHNGAVHSFFLFLREAGVHFVRDEQFTLNNNLTREGWAESPEAKLLDTSNPN